MSIPVLDLQKMSYTKLDEACREWGFFALQGHGLDQGLREESLRTMQSFFTQPLPVKNRIRRTAENCWGFYDAELTKNRRDWKEIVDIGAPAHSGPLAGANPQWPELHGFKQPMQALHTELHRVALEVVSAVMQALEAHIDLDPVFADHSSFLRLNHYPPCPDPATNDTDGHLGISHHTDAGAVTVLMQDEHPGLQVYRNARWHTVQPQVEALIINIGDIVQVWSNNRYPAPLHRVLAHRHEHRYSAPYFLNPSYEHNYAPLASQRSPDAAPHYRPINWGEFRLRRSAGDYADHGQEVQISDYEIDI